MAHKRQATRRWLLKPSDVPAGSRQARLLFEAVSRGVGLAFGLLFPKLLLPSENARFIPGFLGLRNHTEALIGPRNRGPRENVVGFQREDSSRSFNRAVKIFLGVIRLRQAMKRVDQLWIELQRSVVFFNRGIEFPFAKEINSSVIVVFGGHQNPCANAPILPSQPRRPSAPGAAPALPPRYRPTAIARSRPQRHIQTEHAQC